MQPKCTLLILGAAISIAPVTVRATSTAKDSWTFVTSYPSTKRDVTSDTSVAPNNVNAFDQALSNDVGTSSDSSIDSSSKRWQATGIGLQLGTIGHPYSGMYYNMGGLGMDFLWGGRAVAEFALGNNFVFRPSLGYFFSNQQGLSSSSNEQDVEFGALIDYAAVRTGSFEWLVGIANRGDLLFTTISSYGLPMYGGSYTTPTIFQYRVGPETTVEFKLTKGIDLTLSTELDYSLNGVNSSSYSPYGSLGANNSLYLSFTLGAIYRL